METSEEHSKKELQLWLARASGLTTYLNTLLILVVRKYMAASRIGERLQRLAASGICSCETPSEFADDLKKLADKSMSPANSEAKSKVFKAFSDSIRLRILGLLSSREMCVCEVMVALGLTQPTASHHLRILENVALVKDRKEGKWVFYSIASPDFFEGIRKLEIF